jgi:hypothetical protein
MAPPSTSASALTNQLPPSPRFLGELFKLAA